jgi:hypothetical protein
VTSSPAVPTVVKDHALLKVWLGHAADRDSLLAIVAAEHKAAEDLLDEVRYSAGRAEAAQHGYAALVERFCERLAAARLAAIEELATALASGPASGLTSGPASGLAVRDPVDRPDP